MRMNLNDEELKSIIGDDTEGWESLHEEIKKRAPVLDKFEVASLVNLFSSHLTLLEGKVSNLPRFNFQGIPMKEGCAVDIRDVLEVIKQSHE